MRYITTCRLLWLAVLLLVQPVKVLASDTFLQSLSSGDVTGSFRLRSESVDDTANKNAHALTLRSRLAYKSADFYGWSGTLEFDDTRIVAGQDNYAPEKAGFATVADPRITEMNQVFIRYQADYGVTAVLGRQRIVLDNQRFIGASTWRQDDQTFDAFTVRYQHKKFSLYYAYMDKVNGITPALDANVSHHLVNLSYQWMTALNSTAYLYRLHDNKQFANPALDNETTGVRLNGSILTGKTGWKYTAELAQQSAMDFDAYYLLAELGFSLGRYSLTLGYEKLGSDDGLYGFQTPLATKHAFNGWADKFVNTPADGLQDIYASAGVALAGVSLSLAWHQYRADHDSRSYGDELNAMAVYRINSNLSIGSKYAYYRADAFSTDTEKFWLWTELTF